VNAYATGPVSPQELFFAPVRAVRRVMEKEGKSIGDYDLIEANEAFAVQAWPTAGSWAGTGTGST
jgi:acetyl-CoA C-acetyltransferase